MIDRLTLWGLKPGRIRDDIELPGSPERCIERRAVEDEDGRVWMLEQLRPGQFDRRERIGGVLTKLAGAGLPVPAYKPGIDGRYAVEMGGAHYQLSPYVPGDPLPQPEFIEDADRGRNLGSFLVSLHRAGLDIRDFDLEPEFILEDYVNELMAAMASRQPGVHEGLMPVLPVLAPLFEAWFELPAGLCQGDFHPLNVIWSNTNIAAVIDWEFSGIRPALFDAANCLGCVGIEDPPALVRGLAPAMLQVMGEGGCLEPTGFHLLPELTLGLRFAWMSEWLRRQDREMVELEVRYMRLLANSIDTLMPAWKKIVT